MSQDPLQLTELKKECQDILQQFDSFWRRL